MIKEALTYLVDLAKVAAGEQKAKIVEFHGRPYILDNNGKAVRILADAAGRMAFSLSTLKGMVDMLKADHDKWLSSGEAPILHVESAERVVLSTVEISNEERKHRYALLIAQANLPAFNYGHYMSREEFQIALMTAFAPTQHRDEIITLIGNMKAEKGVQQEDNGFTQKVTVLNGITTLGTARIPHPAVLAPYRSFPELAPVESPFLCRAREGGGGIQLAIMEADGGRWELEAVDRVYTYLTTHLAELIDEGQISVIR